FAYNALPVSTGTAGARFPYRHRTTTPRGLHRVDHLHPPIPLARLRAGIRGCGRLDRAIAVARAAATLRKTVLERAAGPAHRADRALSRRASRAGADGVHLPGGRRRGGQVVARAFGGKRRRRGREGPGPAVGPECPVAG